MKRACLAAFFALCSVTRMGAAEVPVYNTNNALAGSLRQAIQDASPGDTIVFQIPTSDPRYDPTTAVFTITLTGENGLGEVTIAKNLTIDPRGQKITIRRMSISEFRIFNVTAGVIATLRGLTIAEGAASRGGNIRNDGHLTLRDCTIRNGLGIAAGGGGVYNAGTLVVVNCTFTGNGDYNEGGGILNLGDLTVRCSTIAGNVNAGVNESHGIKNEAGGTARIGNTVIVDNNIGSTPRDVKGVFISEGYNLIGNTTGSSGFGAMGDQLGATPAQANLSPLRDNGGPTFTRRPLPGSVAIDQGNRGLDANNQSINSDQRGFLRPVDLPGIPNAVGGDGSDIGAAETGTLQAGPTFTITNASGHGDGICSADDCTWMDAISAADSNADANTILFAPGVGPVITPQSSLAISRPLSIIGPGARRLIISGANSRRILGIEATSVSISGLTLASGLASGAQGVGGAIHNAAELTMTDCTVASSSSAQDDGGGLWNRGTATLVRCTFIGNTAPNGFGGGVYSEGMLTVRNCTFTGNSAVRGGGLISRAAGGAAMMTLRNCTITNNTATDGVAMPGFGGGGVFAEGNNQQYFAANNLIAHNTATNDPDVRGNYTSQGNNLIGIAGDSTGFSNGVNGDKIGTSAQPLNAQLGSFGNHGGHTDTFSLLSNSPAIGMGNDALAPSTDQRGFGRNGTSDIGAFEFAGTFPEVRITSITRLTSGEVVLQGLGVPNAAHSIQASPTPHFNELLYIGSTTADALGGWQLQDAGAIALLTRFYRATFP